MCAAEPPTVGSLYAGIGGWDLAFTLAGWDLRWQCEVDPYRRRVLAGHWPGLSCFRDGTDPSWLAPPVDALVAACPTQTFADGDPVHDWVWRRVEQAGPTWVVVETCAGHPADLRFAAQALGRLGYDAAVVPAAFGEPAPDFAVNWLRYLLLAVRHRARGTATARRLLMGRDVRLVVGRLTEEATGGLRIRNGALRDDAADPAAAGRLARAFGFPPGWLPDGTADEVTRAVRDATAVPVALEVARLLARPAWKREAP